MRSVWAITYANLRSGKGHAASLFLFVLIATLFLSLGLLLAGFGDAYDSRSEALHAPHVVLLESENLYTPEQEDFVTSYPGVTEVEKQHFVMVDTDIKYGSSHVQRTIVLLDAAAEARMNGLTVMQGAPPRTDTEACVPYILKSGGGYKLGDTLALQVAGTTWSYTISCFTEDLLFGPASMSRLQVYVTSPQFERRADENPELRGILIRARMTNPNDADRLSNIFTRKFFIEESAGPGGWWRGMTYSIAKLVTVYLAGMTASLFLIFAAILVAVSLLVIRFRIRNSIEEATMNTGSLKAIGHTERQLIQAILLQFGLIAAAGIVGGTAASYALMPSVMGVLEVQTAMRLRQGFDPVRTLIPMAAVLLAVVAVTWFSSRKLRTMTPITALRKGLSTHSFRRNYFPLERSRGALIWLLAVKYAMQSRRQSVMMLVIITAVGFAAGVGTSVYDNLAAHPDAFTRLYGGEPAAVVGMAPTPQEVRDAQEFIRTLPNVRKTLLTEGTTAALTDDFLTYPSIADDYALMEWQAVYEGRNPKHDNEIAVSGLLAENLGKTIGDQVTVTMFGKTADFLIVGLMQGATLVCRLTTAGVQRLSVDFQPRMIFVYLDDRAKSGETIEAINQHFGKDNQVSWIDETLSVDSEFQVYRALAQAVSLIILAVTLLVVLLSIWLVMSTMILRRRREFGIEKALGFTNRQLMNQLALHFAPIITIGIVIGATAGAWSFNPLFVALTRNIGITTSSMPVPYGLMLGMCAALIAISYVFSLLVARRLRTLSVVSLVTE